MSVTNHYMNNILYCIKATKFEKPNQIKKNKDIFQNNYKRVILSHCKDISSNISTNNNISVEIKSNREKNHIRFISLNNNKIYDYKALPRKNIMHIKTLSSREKCLTSNTKSLNRDNISFSSISNITPNKKINRDSINNSTYSSGYSKTASSSNKYIQRRKIISYKKNIKQENLKSKFKEEVKNTRKIIKNFTWNEFNFKKKLEDEKMTEIKKRNERRNQETKRLLINVEKKKCPICNKLIIHYAFQIHYLSHPSEIFPWIYLGNFLNANNAEEIRQLKIKYILNCALEVKVFNLPKEIKYCHLNIIDNPKENLLQYFDKAFNFIEMARQNQCNILIHCKLGRSRSTSILIAYLIKNFGYNVNTALEMIKSKRKQINPNLGFIRQLYAFERYISKYKAINNNGNNYKNIYYN